MKKTELLKILNEIAPLRLQVDWDNSGMQLDLGKEEINTVFVAMEISRDIVEEAKAAGADMIITHHPLLLKFFAPVSLTAVDVTHSNIFELIKSGIEVYSAHTCFDIADGGNNDYLCSMLGLKQVTVEAEGIRLGSYSRPRKLAAVEKEVYEKLGQPADLVSGGDPDKMIKTVALCTGGASEFWPLARAMGADLYISGEIKHHDAILIRQTEMAFIAGGHAGTEWIFAPNMASQLEMISAGQLKVVCTEDHQVPFERRV